MIKLSEISTLPPKELKKKIIKRQFKLICQEIAEYQVRLFAEKKQSLLIVIQGMDATGKSSTIRDVFSYVNPMGVHIKSFVKPTEEEFSHDFLWRVHTHMPAKGMIQVFDRSHYEDILIQRVHAWINEDRVKQRMKHINAFEELVAQENNTAILKFYLHVTKEEQYVDLMERKTDETKHWKHNENDWKEREYWDDYMKAYEDIFANCSETHPWAIVPAGKSWYKKYIVAKTILDTLKSLDPQYPKLEEIIHS